MGRIEPLLPQVDGRGRPWRDHRQVVNVCCGGYGPGLLGATCPSGMGRGRPSTSGSPAERPMARGRSCWGMSRSMMTRGAGWSGSSPLTPRSTGPTSTPRAPVKGGRRQGRTGRSGPLAGASGTRSIPGRARHRLLRGRPSRPHPAHPALPAARLEPGLRARGARSVPAPHRPGLLRVPHPPSDPGTLTRSAAAPRTPVRRPDSGAGAVTRRSLRPPARLAQPLVRRPAAVRSGLLR